MNRALDLAVCILFVVGAVLYWLFVDEPLE